MSAETPLSLVVRGLTEHLRAAHDDHDLLAVATAVMNAADELYRVAAAGFGSESIYFEAHWPADTRMCLTRRLDPALKKAPQVKARPPPL